MIEIAGKEEAAGEQEDVDSDSAGEDDDEEVVTPPGHPKDGLDVSSAHYRCPLGHRWRHWTWPKSSLLVMISSSSQSMPQPVRIIDYHVKWPRLWVVT